MKTRVLAVPGTWDTKAPIVLLGHSQGAGEVVDAVDAEGVAFSDVVEGVGKSRAFFP